MVGVAFSEGFKEIGLFGFDLILGTEYSVQKACLEFWLGMAHARGINVRIPAESARLKHAYRYGYEREPDWGPLSMAEVSRRIEHLSGERNKRMALINALDGAIAEGERWAGDAGDMTPQERLGW